MNPDTELDFLLRESERLYFQISIQTGIITGAKRTLDECRALHSRLEALPFLYGRRARDFARCRSNLIYVRDECQQSDQYIAHDLLELPDDTGCKDDR